MKILSNISAIGSIIGFLIPYFSAINDNTTAETSSFQFICLIVFVISSIIVLYLEYKNRPKIYKGEKEIANYMLNWISEPGRTVILTRDMSWASSSNIMNKLIDKSRNKELMLFMFKKTKDAKTLEDLGAEVYEYYQLNFTPESRFTIIRFGRSDAKLAIGRTGNKGEHIITEFECGIHPQFHIALDLVTILKEINK